MVVLIDHLSTKLEVLARLSQQAPPGSLASRSSTSSRPARVARRGQRRFTAAEAGAIAEQYKSGQTMNQLARRYRVHRHTIAYCLHAQQIMTRQVGLLPADVPAAASLYEAGWSLARIGKKYGIADTTVRTALSEYGVQIRPRRGTATDGTTDERH